jgi:hypothetical protein
LQPLVAAKEKAMAEQCMSADTSRPPSDAEKLRLQENMDEAVRNLLNAVKKHGKCAAVRQRMIDV